MSHIFFTQLVSHTIDIYNELLHWAPGFIPMPQLLGQNHEIKDTILGEWSQNYEMMS